VEAHNDAFNPDAALNAVCLRPIVKSKDVYIQRVQGLRNYLNNNLSGQNDLTSNGWEE